jgi:membrane protease YdiL (CAAX protease family)
VSDPRTRFTRAVLLATAAVGLVALVALAAGDYRVGGSDSTHASPYAIDVILTVVIALYLVGAAAVVAIMFWGGLELRRFPRQQTKKQRTFRMVALLIGAAVLVTIAANRYHWRSHPQQPAQQPVPTQRSNNQKHKNPASQQRHEPQLRLAPFFAVLGAAAVAFTALLLAERRRRSRLPKGWDVVEALSDVLDETLDDLRAESDPRRAVIAAYARMERSLAAHGIPRRRFEAPHEYLRRVLSEVSGGRLAATRLTALFERARFSPHEIDAGMKADAIEAIENLQADLAAAEAEEAAAAARAAEAAL